MTDESTRRQRLYAALLLTALATALRVVWAVKVPTIPVGDFAMYRESANYLAEHGRLDGGFIYMPGLVLLLAAVRPARPGPRGSSRPRRPPSRRLFFTPCGRPASRWRA